MALSLTQALARILKVRKDTSESTDPYPTSSNPNNPVIKRRTVKIGGMRFIYLADGEYAWSHRFLLVDEILKTKEEVQAWMHYDPILPDRILIYDHNNDTGKCGDGETQFSKLTSFDVLSLATFCTENITELSTTVYHTPDHWTFSEIKEVLPYKSVKQLEMILARDDWRKLNVNKTGMFPGTDSDIQTKGLEQSGPGPIERILINTPEAAELFRPKKEKRIMTAAEMTAEIISDHLSIATSTAEEKTEDYPELGRFLIPFRTLPSSISLRGAYFLVANLVLKTPEQHECLDDLIMLSGGLIYDETTGRGKVSDGIRTYAQLESLTNEEIVSGYPSRLVGFIVGDKRIEVMERITEDVVITGDVCSPFSFGKTGDVALHRLGGDVCLMSPNSRFQVDVVLDPEHVEQVAAMNYIFPDQCLVYDWASGKGRMGDGRTPYTKLPFHRLRSLVELYGYRATRGAAPLMIPDRVVLATENVYKRDEDDCILNKTQRMVDDVRGIIHTHVKETHMCIHGKSVKEMITEVLEKSEATKKIVEECGIERITIEKEHDCATMKVTLGHGVTLQGSWTAPANETSESK